MPPVETGSTALTEEQQDWYLERFGVRYLRVQETPALPPRRIRRGRLRGQADLDLLNAHVTMRRRLSGIRRILGAAD